MAENMRVQGPVKVVDNTRDRVALDLARELNVLTPEAQDGFLRLYARCLLTIDSPHLGVEEIRNRSDGK